MNKIDAKQRSGTLSEPGIDNSTLKPIVVSITDYEALKQMSNKTLDTTGITMPILNKNTGEYLEIGTIVIRDNVLFKELTIGVNVTKGNKIRYVKLNLQRVGMDNNNLIPYDMSTYKKRVDMIIQYVLDKYKIELDKNDLKGETLELNTNIILERPFEEYISMLEMMFKCGLGGKHRFKGEPSYDENKNITGFILRNGSMSLKIYNKKLQLEEVKQQYINMEVMRIEWTLKDQKVLEDTFGTCYLEKITDEQIKEVFLRFVRVNLIDKVDGYIEKTNKELPKILKAEKKRDIKKWKRSFLLKAGYVAFDIESILELIKAESPKHYKRDIKKLQQDIEDLNGLHDNLLKFTEIKTKLFI